MCFGAILPALLGAGLSIAGGAIQRREEDANARRQRDARNEELRRTMAKNDVLASQSRSIYDKRAKDIAPAAMENIQAGQQAERTDAITDSMPDLEDIPLAGSTPEVVRTEIANRLAQVLSEGKEEAKALGRLGSYGDSWFQQGARNADVGRRLAVNSDYTAGNLAILPAAQDIAETRAYKPISPLGGILQGLGNAIGSGGGSFFGGGGLARRSYTSMRG